MVSESRFGKLDIIVPGRGGAGLIVYGDDATIGRAAEGEPLTTFGHRESQTRPVDRATGPAPEQSDGTKNRADVLQ